MELEQRCTLLLLVAIFLLWAIPAEGQNRRAVTGVVSDERTGEVLVGVSVTLKDQLGKGTITDNKGRYNLELPQGRHTLVVSYLGYELLELSVEMGTKAMRRNIELKQTSFNLTEVVVTSRRADATVTDPQTGVTQLEVEQLNKLPVLMGERDVIKSLELLPGVKSAGEGSSGFFVRGGTADQNLIILDNVSVYNASHLMGFFSTFNSDVLRDVALYKGPIPAQYGERLASILDVQQRNGDMQRYRLSGGIGLISSKLNMEGPIKKGKSSFLLGARRTYADALARMSGIEKASDAYLYFYDLNMKLYFALTDRDQFSVSGYLGRDKTVMKDMADMSWGNAFLNARWTHTFSPVWLSATSVHVNQYNYGFNMNMGMEMAADAKVRDYGLKQEFHYKTSEEHQWRFGLQSTWHDIAPGDFDINSDEANAVRLHHRYSWENGLYASGQFSLSDRLKVLAGLRLSLFSAMGNGEYYELNKAGEVCDSTWYSRGRFVKTYVNLEPRLSAVYGLNDVSSLKTSYARTTQNMHLLTYVAQGTPFDRWTSSSNNIKPQVANQFTLGYFRNFRDNAYELSVEAYYKDMRNLIDYKDHAELQGRDVIDSEILTGRGRAYGLELMLRKRTGRLTGWLGYTLSKSEKKIDGINQGHWYNAYQDRTHDISVVGIYELSRKWTLSATWIYYTGNAITYPCGKYQIEGKDIMYYAERNGYRAPAYHRLDLGATLQLKKTAKYESELAFSLYNAYGRRNAYMIQFRTNDDDPTRTSAYRYALFAYVPSVSWNFKF